jgi:hypothetical protein
MCWCSPYFPRSIHTECWFSMDGVEISEDAGVSTHNPDTPLLTEHYNIFKALRLALRSHIHPLTDDGFSFGFSPAPTSHESSDGRRPIMYRLSVAIESRISRSRHRAALLRRHIISHGVPQTEPQGQLFIFRLHCIFLFLYPGQIIRLIEVTGFPFPIFIDSQCSGLGKKDCS